MARNRKLSREDAEELDRIKQIRSYSPGKARLYSDHPKDDEDETHPPRIHSAVVPADKPIEREHAQGS